MITVHTHPALSTPVPTDHPSRVTPPPQGTLRRLVGRVAFALVALVVTLAIGQGSALAAGDPSPSTCHTQGNRECGVGGPHGPRAGHCPDGGTYAVRRNAAGTFPLCRYGSSGKRSGGDSGGSAAVDEGPQSVSLSLDTVAPLPMPQTTGYGPNGLTLDAFLGR